MQSNICLQHDLVCLFTTGYRGVTGGEGGGRGAIAPPPFGRIEGAAIAAALLLAPPVLESHLRPWDTYGI
jgi:hypothetical protein